MFIIEYLESVIKKDIPSLSKADRQNIKKAIETKLVHNPIEFGKPLQYSLKGCRRLRVGDYRVVFKIDVDLHKITIVAIRHRKKIYKDF